MKTVIFKWSWWVSLLFLASLLFLRQDAMAGDVEGDEPAKEHKWSLTLYLGHFVQESIRDIFAFRPSFRDESYIGVAALSREFWRYKDLLNLELEGQVGKHFGIEDHWEFNGLLILRWRAFPWDRYVETSLAVGDGLSWASEVPELELQDDPKAVTLLNYLMFELTLGPPQHPQWDFVIRAHHRSGAFGTFSGVHGGANYLCAGIKYKF